ncbi:MAG: IS1634 family transposase [Bradymonadales bacterium]|jgi:transposase
MFIRLKERPNGKTSVQIVESIRRGKQVQQKIVRHIGNAVSKEEIEIFRTLAKDFIRRLKQENDRQPMLPYDGPEKLISRIERNEIPLEEGESISLEHAQEEQRFVTGITDVLGNLYDELGYHSLLRGTRKNAQWNAILKACVLSRLANPTSKRKTASYLERDLGITIDLDKIYRMMDHVSTHEEHIKRVVCNNTIGLFEQSVDVLFFDVTTLYFESFESDELKRPGFSKDNKFSEVQVMLALVTTHHGLPVSYYLFPGNTSETQTLLSAVNDLRQNMNVRDVTLVADRAMFSKANLALMDAEGISYIVACKLKSLSKKVKDSILNDTYDKCVIENEPCMSNEYEVQGRRLVVNYSPKRAYKDRSDRDRLIKRMLKKAKSNSKLSIHNVLPNRGTAKYLDMKNVEDLCIDEAKIAEDARWDGLHGILTNIQHLSAVELLVRYRGLWQIEEAFRLNKHDLRMRPIYHWTPDRVKAHIAICYLAYSVAKHALYRLNILSKLPMSFEQLRNELLHMQASVLRDNSTGRLYELPSAKTPVHAQICKIFGVKFRQSIRRYK